MSSRKVKITGSKEKPVYVNEQGNRGRHAEENEVQFIPLEPIRDEISR